MEKEKRPTQKEVKFVVSALRSHRRPLVLAGTILIGASVGQLSIVDSAHAEPSSSPSLPKAKSTGNSEEGRKLFNGKGFCFKCHGQDGYIDRRPEMDPEMARLIEQFNPQPADLRNPAALTSKNDQDRIETIKNGHRGTAMFPHRFLRDAEINDILAYLSVLRSEGKLPLQGSGDTRH